MGTFAGKEFRTLCKACPQASSLAKMEKKNPPIPLEGAQ